MITSGFLSAQDRKELLGCIKRHTEEHGVARRANALLLLDDGLPFAQVAKVLYLHNDTVRGWYKQYQTGGWDLVASNDWQGGQSRMTVAQEAVLIAWLEGRVCRSVAEVRAYILAEFGIHYAHSGCVKLLRRLGFEYRKPRAVPRVADPEDQAAFIAFYTGLIKYLQPDEAVYFADAVHPEHQSKPASEAFPEKVDRLFRFGNAKKSCGWFKKGSNPAVNTTSGRGRVNVHAALNLENFDTPFVAPDTVNGVSAAQLLAKIEARNKKKRTVFYAPSPDPKSGTHFSGRWTMFYAPSPDPKSAYHFSGRWTMSSGTTPPTTKARRSAPSYPAPNAPSILSNCRPIAPI